MWSLKVATHSSGASPIERRGLFPRLESGWALKLLDLDDRRGAVHVWGPALKTLAASPLLPSGALSRHPQLHFGDLTCETTMLERPHFGALMDSSS